MGEGTEPRPAGAVRTFWARHPRLVDTILAFLCAIWIFDSPDGITFPQVVDVRWLAISLIVSAAMLFRRSRPWLVLLTVVAGGALAGDHFIGVALACALHALAAHRSTRDALLGSVLATVVLLAAAAPGRDARELRDRAIVYLVIALVAVLLGANALIRKRYLTALLGRNAQLAREKEQEVRLAAARERTRIAHDLHDIVAHSLTVMVRLADGAAAVAESDPARARSASERVAGVGRDAMVDMRRLLEVLRDEPPGEDDLEALFSTFRAAGLPVDVRRQGVEPASPRVRNAVFRTLQESLTNALRYADRVQRVVVDLDFRDDPIRIEVADDGHGVGPAPSVGSQQGLQALRERLSRYGGTVEAGPRPTHGWSVRVVLPTGGEAAGA